MEKEDKIFLLGSAEVKTPSFRELKQPLGEGKIAKLFCTECGEVSEVDDGEIFTMLEFARNKDIDLYLADKIDWSKKYIQSNFCNNCLKGHLTDYLVRIKKIKR